MANHIVQNFHVTESALLLEREIAAMGDDETLIEAVREFDCLWKVKSKAYKDLRAKENAWRVVAEKICLLINV